MEKEDQLNKDKMLSDVTVNIMPTGQLYKSPTMKYSSKAASEEHSKQEQSGKAKSFKHKSARSKTHDGSSP